MAGSLVVILIFPLPPECDSTEAKVHPGLFCMSSTDPASISRVAQLTTALSRSKYVVEGSVLLPKGNASFER